jgi:hypothetical protein
VLVEAQGQLKVLSARTVAALRDMIEIAATFINP